MSIVDRMTRERWNEQCDNQEAKDNVAKLFEEIAKFKTIKRAESEEQYKIYIEKQPKTWTCHNVINEVKKITNYGITCIPMGGFDKTAKKPSSKIAKIPFKNHSATCNIDFAYDKAYSIKCGLNSNITGLDVDVGDDGGYWFEKILEALNLEELLHGDNPKVNTPSGGYHLWFPYIPELGNSVASVDIDIKFQDKILFSTKLHVDIKNENGLLTGPGSIYDVPNDPKKCNGKRYYFEFDIEQTKFDCEPEQVIYEDVTNEFKESNSDADTDSDSDDDSDDDSDGKSDDKLDEKHKSDSDYGVQRHKSDSDYKRRRKSRKTSGIVPYVEKSTRSSIAVEWGTKEIPILKPMPKELYDIFQHNCKIIYDISTQKFEFVQLPKNKRKESKDFREDIPQSSEINNFVIDNLPVELANNYGDWLKVVFACKKLPNGLAAAKRFSERTTVAGYYDVNKVEEVFANANGKIGFGSLVYLLKKHNRKAYETYLQMLLDLEQINADDPYVWGDFKRDYSSKTFESFDALKKTFYKDANRVIAKILAGSGCYIKKDDVTDRLFGMIPDINKKIDFFIKYKEKINDEDTVNKVKATILLSNGIKEYNKLVCDPDNKDPNVFNMWRGFQGKLVDVVNMDLIQPMLDLIRTVWCNNNDTYFAYVLSWLAYNLKHPGQPVEIILFLTGSQGAGKNFVTNFLVEYVFGDPICTSINDFTALTGKFNRILEGKKLIVVNELSSTKDQFKSNFDKFKSMSTDVKMIIEPKGVDPYQVKAFPGFILLSNHPDSIMIEQTDRRYFCLKTNDVYVKNDAKWWSDLKTKTYNQEVGNHFYTFLMSYEMCNLKPVPMTEMKEEIISISGNSTQKFIRKLKEQIQIPMSTEEGDSDRESPFKLINDVESAQVMFKCYQNWCSENGERNVTSNYKFGLEMKKDFESVRNNGIKYKLKN